MSVYRVHDPSFDGANTRMFGLEKISEMAKVKEDLEWKKQYVNYLPVLAGFV